MEKLNQAVKQAEENQNELTALAYQQQDHLKEFEEEIDSLREENQALKQKMKKELKIAAREFEEELEK